MTERERSEVQHEPVPEPTPELPPLRTDVDDLSELVELAEIAAALEDPTPEFYAPARTPLTLTIGRRAE